MSHKYTSKRAGRDSGDVCQPALTKQLGRVNTPTHQTVNKMPGFRRSFDAAVPAGCGTSLSRHRRPRREVGWRSTAGDDDGRRVRSPHASLTTISRCEPPPLPRSQRKVETIYVTLSSRTASSDISRRRVSCLCDSSFIIQRYYCMLHEVFDYKANLSGSGFERCF